MGTKSLSAGIVLIFIAVIFGLYTWVSHSDRAREAKALEIGVEGYIYGYPLVLMDATKEAALNPPAGGRPAMTINKFYHFRELLSPSFTLVVSPNVDTLYSNAWLDLSAGPLLIHVPETTGRYYLMEMLDSWTNVFANPGTRTSGSQAKDFVVIGPGFEGDIPANTFVINSPTNMAWIILRIECFGEKDYPAIRALQDQFTITPTQTAESSPSAPILISPSKLSPVEYVAQMDADEFFGVMAELLKTNSPPPADAPMIEKLGSIDIYPGKSFEKMEIDPAISHGLDKAVKVAQGLIKNHLKSETKEHNGWNILLKDIGTYGTDYLMRASVAESVLGANLPEDAVYPFTYTDISKTPLNGQNSYTLHFDKDGLPPVRAFWSLTIYNADHNLVANPEHRYAIQSHSQLQYNKDGSLDITVQKKPPSQTGTNWLSSPDGEFNLILRMYWPEKKVLDGEWSPPPVEVNDHSL